MYKVSIEREGREVKGRIDAEYKCNRNYDDEKPLGEREREETLVMPESFCTALSRRELDAY